MTGTPNNYTLVQSERYKSQLAELKKFGLPEQILMTLYWALENDPHKYPPIETSKGFVWRASTEEVIRDGFLFPRIRIWFDIVDDDRIVYLKRIENLSLF